MELRGYDDYEVTLGDQIRGERASLGKSIEDVERELHIKASLILGIENADLAAFPNPSVVSGYVRSYARYLRVDPEEFYLRFCEESGFVPPSAAFGGVTGAPPGARIGQRLEGSPFDQSRFANVPSQSRFAARVSLGWLASALALVALVGGIGYGGFALLQNVQRVGFALLFGEIAKIVFAVLSMASDADIDLDIELFTWIGIAAVFVLAEVFHEGAKMKEEQDLTV